MMNISGVKNEIAHSGSTHSILWSTASNSIPILNGTFCFHWERIGAKITFIALCPSYRNVFSADEFRYLSDGSVCWMLSGRV